MGGVDDARKGAHPEHYQSTDKKGFYDPDSRPKKLRRIFFFTVKRSTTGFVSKTRMSERGVEPSAANICFYERPKGR